MTSETRPGRGSGLVGTSLEQRYRIDALIARGGMSVVYRGVDARLHRPVAIKVMDSRYSGDRSFIHRFEREAQAAARLHHPNVVAVYDQGVDRTPDGDLVYLVMQLVQGCTLRDLLEERGRLDLPLALSVLEPTLAAVAAAHQAGMVHRDIKPENVLVGEDESVKVADFGLVRAAASAGTTSGSVILGTVAYLSPEQVTTGAADTRTDVYAAGIVLYEMLTGEPPYTGDTALSVAYRHVNDDVPAPSERVPEVPPAVDDLVMRATRRDPQQRPVDGAAFLAEVQQLRQQLGMPTVPVPIPASQERTARVETDNGPPTDQLAPVPAEPHPSPSSQPFPPQSFPQRASQPDQFATNGGPRGTRAIARSEADDRPSEEGAVRERPRRRGALWTALVVVLVLVVGAGAWLLGSSGTVQVPRVNGEPEEVAQKVLAQAGLSAEVSRQYDNSVPAGRVKSSSPAEGSKVHDGISVTLVVSKGRPKVPSIAAGTPAAQAESKLRDAGLQPQHDGSEDQYSSSVPAGAVLGVDPQAGTAVPISSPVKLVLSKGARPVPVPNLQGADQNTAFSELRSAGFDPYLAGQQFNGDVEAGHVIATSPAAGTPVPMSGKPRIGVVVSNAVTVPSFQGASLQQAQQAAAQLGVQLDVQSLFHRPNAIVLGQSPQAGSKVQPGSVVHLTAL
jgi:serine/threonine-protein kinase